MVDRLDRRRARDRAAAVGAADAAEVRGVHDLGAAGDGGDRHAGAERLGGHDEVGHDAVVLDGEEAAGASHAALHFVGDHHDAVLPSHSSRIRCRKRGGTGNEARFPCTGSMIIAATADGSTCATSACLELPDAEVDDTRSSVMPGGRPIQLRDRQAGRSRARTARSRS